MSEVITGSDLNQQAVTKKFKQWDEVISTGALEKEDKSALKLLNDPVIYEYAFFKDDDESPFTLTSYQDEILSTAAKHDFSADHPSRYILFRASNQLGKSRALRAYARFLALTKENINIVMISKSLPQSQFLLAEIRRELQNSRFANTWQEDVGETANTTMLTFEPRPGVINRIICAPAGEGALGYPIHYLFLDEADFYDEAKKLFWKVFFARTKKTKGQIILFSNPNPDVAKSESLMWELWKGDLFTKKYHFNFLDAPWNTEEEFERDRRNSPSHIFASTHLGNWSDDGGAFLSEKEIEEMMEPDWKCLDLPAVDRPVFVGIDLGKMKDSTVITLGVARGPSFDDDKYKDLDVVYIEEMPLGTTYDAIMRRYVEIKEFYEQFYFGIERMGYDATGQKTFGDLLKRYNVDAVAVDFASKQSNKTILYNDFKLMAENRKIKVADHPKARKQLASLQFKYTENKKLRKVENKSDNIHDDIPDSIVILIHISVKPSNIPVSVTIAKASSKTDSKEFNELWEMMGL